MSLVVASFLILVAAFLVGAGFAILGAIAASLLISSRDSREMAAAAQRGEAPAMAV